MAVIKSSIDKKALILSSVYVGIATLFLFSIYPSDPFSFEGLYDSTLYYFLNLLFLPGQIFSAGIRFAESGLTFLVLLSQVVHLVIWYFLFKFILKKLYT